MSEFTNNIEKTLLKFREIFPKTPLIKSQHLSKKYNANIYLKREDLTPVRSYKIRGAFNMISDYLEKKEQADCHFFCASAGNHAQGFAFACKHFKVKGTVFMPVTTPKQKIARTKTHGGKYINIELVGDIFDDSLSQAKKTCKEKNGIFIPPFDHEKLIEGGGTVASEIIEQMKEKNKKIDIIFAPVGGGGLSAGASEFFREISPSTKFYCVESEGAPTLATSLEKGKPTELKKIDTFADGTAVKLIGEKTFKILKKNIREKIVLCPENRICKTMMTFLFTEGIILEPSGALAIDALRNFEEKDLKGKNIVCVVSGGNFDFERLPDVKERAMRFAGTKKYIILQLPQRPGALRDFLDLLGPNEDIERFEYLKKSARNFGSVLLGISSDKAENFANLFTKLKANNFDFEDVTNNQYLTDLIV